MSQRPIFFDMKHSNNAARIRLWIRLKGMDDTVDTKMIGHDDLETEEYQQVNPLKKVPAFVTEKGLCLFEAFVIMQYLEDRYGGTRGPSLVLDTNPDDRAFVTLLVRIHDLYIASPNCTQPHFSHTQGCMYLGPKPTKFTPPQRTMQVDVRAAKLAEIYKQLGWLEEQIRLPWLAGNQITHADLTWFPTAVFMEFLLPHVFGWGEIFHEKEQYPKLTRWFETSCLPNEHFERVRTEIRGTLESQGTAGRFEDVREEVSKHLEFKWKYI